MGVKKKTKWRKVSLGELTQIPGGGSTAVGSARDATSGTANATHAEHSTNGDTASEDQWNGDVTGFPGRPVNFCVPEQFGEHYNADSENGSVNSDLSGIYVNGLWIPISELHKHANNLNSTNASHPGLLRTVPLLFHPSAMYPRFRIIHAPDVPLYPNYFVPSDPHYYYYLTRQRLPKEEECQLPQHPEPTSSRQSSPYWNAMNAPYGMFPTTVTSLLLPEQQQHPTSEGCEAEVVAEESPPGEKIEDQEMNLETPAQSPTEPPTEPPVPYPYPGYTFGQAVYSVPVCPLLPPPLRPFPRIPWSAAQAQKRRRRRRKEEYADYAIIPERKKTTETNNDVQLVCDVKVGGDIIPLRAVGNECGEEKKGNETELNSTAGNSSGSAINPLTNHSSEKQDLVIDNEQRSASENFEKERFISDLVENIIFQAQEDTVRRQYLPKKRQSSLASLSVDENNIFLQIYRGKEHVRFIEQLVDSILRDAVCEIIKIESQLDITLPETSKNIDFIFANSLFEVETDKEINTCREILVETENLKSFTSIEESDTINTTSSDGKPAEFSILKDSENSEETEVQKTHVKELSNGDVNTLGLCSYSNQSDDNISGSVCTSPIVKKTEEILFSVDKVLEENLASTIEDMDGFSSEKSMGNFPAVHKKEYKKDTNGNGTANKLTECFNGISEVQEKETDVSSISTSSLHLVSDEQEKRQDKLINDENSENSRVNEEVKSVSNNEQVEISKNVNIIEVHSNGFSVEDILPKVHPSSTPKKYATEECTQNDSTSGLSQNNTATGSCSLVHNPTDNLIQHRTVNSSSEDRSNVFESAFQNVMEESPEGKSAIDSISFSPVPKLSLTSSQAEDDELQECSLTESERNELEDVPLDQTNSSSDQEKSIPGQSSPYSYMSYIINSEALIRETELELSKLHQITSRPSLQANHSIYKLAYDENITDQSETDEPITPTPPVLAQEMPATPLDAEMRHDIKRSEIIVHEVDSASDAGSEDVELLPHRYESQGTGIEDKHIYVNKLSLAVELLRTHENLPYDEEFKRVVDDENDAAQNKKAGAQNGQAVHSRQPRSLIGTVNPAFVEDVCQTSKLTAVVSSKNHQYHTHIISNASSTVNGNANEKPQVQSQHRHSRISTADSGVQSEDSGDEVGEEAKEAFHHLGFTENEEQELWNPAEGTATGYRRFGMQARQRLNILTPPRGGVVNPCLCCVIM